MLNRIIKHICEGIAAGLLITIGCCVYLACDVKWVGAILFAVALLTICIMGYSLYTGRIGFLLDGANKEYFSSLFLGLLGNLIATAVVGIAVQYAIPSLHTVAEAMCTLKLQQEWWQTLIRGVLCGVLMYVAVSIYKHKKSVIGVLFAIPVFILSGFEHSIADMGYFAIGGIYSAKAFGFVWLVILGNSIGALILPALALCGKKLGVGAKEAEVAENTVIEENTNSKYNGVAEITEISLPEMKSNSKSNEVAGVAEITDKSAIEENSNSKSDEVTEVAEVAEVACDSQENDDER